MGARRKGRELALQALYEWEVAGDGVAEAVSDFWGRSEASAEARGFGAELVRGVLEDLTRIDGVIAASSEHWRLGRLPQVDRNILRVATYELMCRPDVPVKVAIDEAVEIAKRFGGRDSATFVNGVLDHVASVVGAKEGRDAP